MRDTGKGIEPFKQLILQFGYVQVQEQCDLRGGGICRWFNDAILPPAGIELRSDNEHLIWNQFTRALRKIGVTWNLFC